LRSKGEIERSNDEDFFSGDSDTPEVVRVERLEK
jgi:hypothetical protein